MTCKLHGYREPIGASLAVLQDLERVTAQMPSRTAASDNEVGAPCRLTSSTKPIGRPRLVSAMSRRQAFGRPLVPLCYESGDYTDRVRRSLPQSRRRLSSAPVPATSVAAGHARRTAPTSRDCIGSVPSTAANEFLGDRETIPSSSLSWERASSWAVFIADHGRIMLDSAKIVLPSILDDLPGSAGASP